MNLRTLVTHRTATAVGGVFAAAAIALLPASGFAACDARSGPNRAALVELYTSEGCSSCPPADQALSSLREDMESTAVVVPLSLHVKYWDYIGWKDPYAQTTFDERHSWLVRANRSNTVYTPQFFVGGSAVGSWHSYLGDTIRKLNAQPAAASIRLRASGQPNGVLALDLEATAPAGTAPAALYLALAENGLVSKVKRGENSGATLTHDHVVRAWLGPVRLSGGSARVQRGIALPAAWNRARLEVVAFVQDERTGSVLQALSAQKCAAGA